MWCHAYDIKYELCSSGAGDLHYPFSTSHQQTGDPSSLYEYSFNWKKYANILAQTEILQKRRKRADVNYEIRLLTYINKFLKIFHFVFLLLSVCTEIRDNFKRHFSFSQEWIFDANWKWDKPRHRIVRVAGSRNAVPCLPSINFGLISSRDSIIVRLIKNERVQIVWPFFSSGDSSQRREDNCWHCDWCPDSSRWLMAVLSGVITTNPWRNVDANYAQCNATNNQENILIMKFMRQIVQFN